MNNLFNKLPEISTRTAGIIITVGIAILAIAVVVSLILKPSLEDTQRELSANCVEVLDSHIEGNSWTYGLEGKNGELWCLIQDSDGNTKVKVIEGFGRWKSD